MKSIRSRMIPATAPLWFLAGILLAAACGRAEDPPEKYHRMENRFLFVIDTSSAMKSRAEGVQEAVHGLLASGMKGQLRKGDTIGVWTYSDRLNTDFPMQIWSERGKDGIVSEVRDHVRELHYEKRAHLEKVLPEINKLVAHSERLTVILIFDGADPIKGTPFDRDINELHKQYAHEFKSAHSPFVTVLTARNGSVFDYTINYPGTVVVPPTADPLPPPETNAPPAVAIVPPPPPVTNAPPPVEPKPHHRIEITLSGSNFTHNAAIPPPAPANVVEAVTPPVSPAPPAATNAPAPVAVQPVNTNVPPPEPAVPPPSAASNTAAPPTEVAVKTPPSAPPVAPAAAVPPASTGQQVAMFITAFSLLTIAVVLVLFLIRRSKGGAPTSLISQSIDRSR